MSTDTQSFAGSKTFNGETYFSNTVSIQNKPLRINSDDTQSYTSEDWDASFYADKIVVENADAETTWTVQFPQLSNGQTKTLATTDDVISVAIVDLRS